MRIAAVDALRFDYSEAMRLQALYELRRRLVTETFAEGEVEGGGEALLQAIDRMLDARGGIVLFNDENSAGPEALSYPVEQCVPIRDSHLVEDVDDCHGVEGSANAVVIADDA